MKGTAMPKVRTTMQPLVELNVTEKEASGLAREGLLLDSTATTRDALLRDAIEQSVERPAPTGVDFDFSEGDDEDVVAPIDNRTTVGGNVSPESFTDDDDDTDDEGGPDLDDTEKKE